MSIPTVTTSAADRQLLLQKLAAAATESGHPWPQYAAYEVALETGWVIATAASLSTQLSRTKQHALPIFQTVNLPTREFLAGKWVVENDDFIFYPTWAASFADRKATLVRLAPEYFHYAAALNATDGETYVRQVSMSWSTDPDRADHVISIHRAHFAAQPADEKSIA